MNKKNVREKERPIINTVGLIDNIVQARNNAFILERSKDLDLAIFKTQSKYFSDEKNRNQFLQYLAEIGDKGNTLKQHGIQYLKDLDAPISSIFKSVPGFLTEVSEILKNIENLLPEKTNNAEEDIHGAIEELDRIKDKDIGKISLLSEKITIFYQELTNKINLASNSLECLKKDKDQKKIKEEKEANQDNSYQKNYLKYQENVDILDTGNITLKKAQIGIQGISNNLKIIKKYYENIKPIDKSINVNDYDEAAIQRALQNIRNLNSRVKNNLAEIKKFTEQL